MQAHSVSSNPHPHPHPKPYFKKMFNTFYGFEHTVLLSTINFFSQIVLYLFKCISRNKLKAVSKIFILELKKYDKFCFSNAKTNFDVFIILIKLSQLLLLEAHIHSFTTALYRPYIDWPLFIILKVLTFKWICFLILHIFSKKMRICQSYQLSWYKTLDQE